ncbi:T-complex 11, partial [Saccharata proteae CBS 121410]
GSRMAYNFEHAALYPPITKQSLSELDIASIINNPKLRHDVNFDRELHFRPNFDGAKGKMKLKNAEEYWSALAAELELYAVLFDDSRFSDVCSEASKVTVLRVARKRIPLMFDTIRDIIRNLVPECDQARVEEQLDTPMLMQQIERGVCDLASIASWLSHLLKAHCAPVRDEWVDKMVEQIDTGTRNASGRMMVNGLRELLGILEAMKLDVANHQIRHLRALLIEDTVNFEQKYHLERISRRRILVDRSQHWYALQEVDQQDLDSNPKCKDPGSRVLIQGLLSLLTSGDRHRPFPETFYLDFERLRVLRAEFRDQVYLRMCSETFTSIIRRLGHKDSVSAHTQKTLRETIYALVPINENSGSSSIQHWLVNVDNIAVELVRRALFLCGQATEYDGELVQVVSTQLRRLISMDNGQEFADYARPLKDTLATLVLGSAGSCASLSPVDIFNALIMPTSASSPRTGIISPDLAAGVSKEIPEENYLTDIARRITHIAVVHWRIWGPIVY